MTAEPVLSFGVGERAENAEWWGGFSPFGRSARRRCAVCEPLGTAGSVASCARSGAALVDVPKGRWVLAACERK